MSTEPKPNIEEQLRAFARKRRESLREPLEMPPVTREMLQSEVAHGLSSRPDAPQASAGWSWLTALWPRFAVVGCLLAVILVASLRWSARESKPIPRVAGNPDAQKAVPVPGQQVELTENLANESLAEKTRENTSDLQAKAPKDQAALALRYGLRPLPAPELSINLKPNAGISSQYGGIGGGGAAAADKTE